MSHGQHEVAFSTGWLDCRRGKVEGEGHQGGREEIGRDVGGWVGQRGAGMATGLPPGSQTSPHFPSSAPPPASWERASPVFPLPCPRPGVATRVGGWEERRPASAV